MKYWLMILREELVGGNSTVGQAGKHLSYSGKRVCKHKSWVTQRDDKYTEKYRKSLGSVKLCSFVDTFTL